MNDRQPPSLDECQEGLVNSLKPASSNEGFSLTRQFAQTPSVSSPSCHLQLFQSLVFSRVTLQTFSAPWPWPVRAMMQLLANRR